MSSGTGSHPSEYPRLRWIIFCLVFFAIPEFLVAHWVRQSWEDRTSERLNRKMRSAESVLDSLSRWQSTEFFFETLLGKLGGHFNQWPGNAAYFRKLVASIKHRFSGTVEFVFVNSQGQCIDELSDDRPPKTVLRKFWIDFQKKSSGDRQALAPSWSIYKNYLGSLLRPLEIQNGSVTPAFFEKRRSQILFSDLYQSGMFFVFFNHSPTWETIAIQDQVRRHNLRPGAQPVALIDTADWSKQSIIPPQTSEAELRKALLAFERSPQNTLFHNDQWWFQKVIGPTSRLLLSFPVREDMTVQQERFRVVLLLTIFFALFSWVSMRLMLGKIRFFFSMRYKLLFLSFYVVGLPLIVMGITARGYLAELRLRLENRVFSEASDALRTFDHNLPVILGLIQNTIQKRVLSPLKPGQETYATYLPKMSKFASEFRAGVSFLVDAQGNYTFAKGADGEKDEKTLRIVKPVYVNLLKSLQSSCLDLPEDKETSTAQLVTAAAGFDVEGVYADIVKNMSKIRTMEYGNRKGLQGLFPISDDRGKTTHLAAFTWAHPAIQNVYLRKYLLRLEKKLPETSLYGLSLESAKEHGQSVSRDFPPRYRFLDLIAPLYDRFSSGGKNVQISRRFRGKKYYITMFKGEELYRYFLIAITSDNSITQEIGRVGGIFRTVSLALMLMALTVGNLLARKFLEPIANLSTGVLAIREKDFDIRVPILDFDELGELATTFNEMIENLHENSMGKEVQEQLFPPGKLVLGEYQVRGVSRTATGLGGDYFEYIAIGNRYLLVLLGDATGHGVPAALVMAMAKAVVLQCSLQETTDGMQVMETLNRVIFLGMARKRLMTAACLWVDTEAHTIQSFNGGHPLPFKHFSDGTLAMIPARGTPLGLRNKIQLIPGETTLMPGERILLYTDGLIESIPEEPPRTNFDLFQDYLETRPILPIEQACEDILDHHVHTLTGLPRPDDFTIVILERTGSR